MLEPGDDIQAIVNNNPAGTTYMFKPGTYRMQIISPKDDDIFDGGNNAVLNGSRLLTEWIKEGEIWYVTGQYQEGLRIGEGREMPGHPRASFPEDVFIDDVPLLHAEHIGDVKQGTYYFDYNSDRIYIGDNPSGHKIETGVADQAFTGEAKKVTIQNFIIEKYATPVQFGTIDTEIGINWTVQDNIIQLNHGCGINFGNKSRILRNRIINNGHAGFGGGSKDWLFEGNEVRDNGWAGIDPVWEGGGGKVTETNNGIFRANRISGNNGPGIWLDIDANDIIIEDNVCWNNSMGPGIMFEISSGVIIRNNICINNGTEKNMCQIYISTSSNAKVYGNTVEVNERGGDAIIITNMHRPPANPGINNEIYNNKIIIRSSGMAKTGVINEYLPDSLAVFSKNFFHHNTYHLADINTRYFIWDRGNNYSFAEIQKKGQEKGSIADTELPPINPEYMLSANPRIWPLLTDPPIDISLLNLGLEDPGSGPAIWLKFNETSGNIAKDFSGRENPGLLQNMEGSGPWVKGQSGNALNFDGIDDNVKAGPLGMFRYFTIAMWVCPTSLEKEFNALIHTDGWIKGTVHLMISGNGRLQFSLNGNQNTDQYSEMSVFPIRDYGNWKHIAIVYDANNQTVKFYINGQLNSTRKYSKAVPANLGEFEIGGWNGGGRNFSGKLDDVRIYGRVLSEKEIEELVKLIN